MKGIITWALLCGICFFSTAQTDKQSIHSIKTLKQLEEDVLKIYLQDIDEENTGYKWEESKNKTKFFNEAMLNVLFANTVGSYVSEAGDLNLRNAFATLSVADNSLFVGYTTSLYHKRKTDRLKHILTVGLKAQAKDNFAALFTNDQGADNFGAVLKYSLIGRGIITFSCDDKKKLSAYREHILKPTFRTKATAKAKQLEQQELPYQFYGNKTKEDATKKMQEKIQKEAYLLYGELAEAEVAFMQEHKLYTRLWDHWFTFEAYVPFTDTTFLILQQGNETPVTRTFYPLNASATYTNYLKCASGQQLYVSGQVNYFLNNNIASGELGASTLNTIDQNNPQLITGSQTVYPGNFKRFGTLALKIEVVSFLVDDVIGLSAAVVRNTGLFSSGDWKLGMPISLKDKEGKPTVNFELQWKQLSTLTNVDHIVGINVGFTFGKFVQ